MPVARIDADDDPAGMIGGGVAHQRRVAQRRRPEHDAVDAERQPALDRGAVADPAAELDLGDRRRCGSPSRRRRSCERPAKAPSRSTTCSQVKPASAKCAGLRRGIPVEHGGARHIAADEAHAGAVLQVDRREQDHGVAAGSSRSL